MNTEKENESTEELVHEIVSKVKGTKYEYNTLKFLQYLYHDVLDDDYHDFNY